MADLAVGLTINFDTALNSWGAISMNDRGDSILRKCRFFVFPRLDGLVSLPFIICKANEYMATT